MHKASTVLEGKQKIARDTHCKPLHRSFGKWAGRNWFVRQGSVLSFCLQVGWVNCTISTET